jgi:hypothetical protein
MVLAHRSGRSPPASSQRPDSDCLQLGTKLANEIDGRVARPQRVATPCESDSRAAAAGVAARVPKRKARVARPSNGSGLSDDPRSAALSAGRRRGRTDPSAMRGVRACGEYGVSSLVPREPCLRAGAGMCRPRRSPDSVSPSTCVAAGPTVRSLPCGIGQQPAPRCATLASRGEHASPAIAADTRARRMRWFRRCWALINAGGRPLPAHPAYPWQSQSRSRWWPTTLSVHA